MPDGNSATKVFVLDDEVTPTIVRKAGRRRGREGRGAGIGGLGGPAGPRGLRSGRPPPVVVDLDEVLHGDIGPVVPPPSPKPARSSANLLQAR